MNSLVHVLFLGPVHAELESDADVVLHSADLAAERDAALAEDARGIFKLKTVYMELFVEALGVAVRILGEQRLEDVDALLAQHRAEERAHGVLDFLRCENAKALCAVVDAVTGSRDVAEGALVVLGLEAEVALAHDDDFGEGQDLDLADAVDVAADEGELLAGLWEDTE